MGTNRLDLGRVRGDDGANGQPAVVEVLEETATSYVLGVTYYDDEGVEHIIQTPNLKGTDGGATFTVGSDADLQKWMNAEAGNDYTYVLVKPAAYTLSGTVNLAAAGTEAVMGFGSSLPQVELRGSGSEMVIGLEARACTDVLLVAADGSVRCSNLRGELLTASAAGALAAPATAADYGKVRYGQAETGDSEITGVTPAKLRAGIRAPYNPSFPSLTATYVQGDGDDYLLYSREITVGPATKVVTNIVRASGFNVPSAIKRVLVSLYNYTYRLHILTTDGRLFYAYLSSEGGTHLSCVELASGLPTEPITDIAYNPDTDWTSATPFPVMLTASKLYQTPLQSINYGGTECYYLGDDAGGQVTYLVRHENEKIGLFYGLVYQGPISSTALPADAKLYPAKQALLIKASSYVKVVKHIGTEWSDYADDDPASSQYTPQVRFSPDVFPDGFSASTLFDDDIVTQNLTHLGSGSGWDVPLFMTAPRVLDGKLMSLVMVQDNYQSSGLGDIYAKLVVWEGYEEYDSATGAVLVLTTDQATQSVENLTCAVFKDGKTYQTAPAITDLTYRGVSEHKVGIGFTEKQEVDGVMEYKAGDGAVFLTKEGVQEAAASAKSASVSEVIAHNSGCNRWLRFDPNNRKGLVIKGGTSVSAMINGARVSHTFEQDTAFDLTSSLAGYDITYGRTFAVYLTDIGTQSPAMRIVLTTAQAPANGVLLGWFSTLCTDYGQNYGALVPVPKNAYNPGSRCMVKPYSEDTDPDFAGLYLRSIFSMYTGTSNTTVNALVSHPLALYKAGDILPESVWCRDFHPACVSVKGNYFLGCLDAMVFDAATGKAVDVYGMHKISSEIAGVMHYTSSLYSDNNGTPLVPLYSVPYDVCKVSMLTVGKDLMTRADFYSASIGSPQHAALISIPTELGGDTVHNDLQQHPGASGRLVSFIGCEHMCGALEQWLDGEEHGTLDRQNTINNDIDAAFGVTKGITERILKTAGGTDTAPGASYIDSCGSLAMQVYSSGALPNFVTGRGVCRVISGTRGQA